MFQHFDRTYIINLPERVDRKREMQDQVDRWSIADHTEVVWFDAIRKSTSGPFLRIGSHGAYFSCLEILEKEKSSGADILILQDDCNFTEECVLPVAGNWDILYGGYEASDPDAPESSDIIGAHCMGFRSAIIAPLHRYLTQEYADYLEGDAILAPIDGSIVNFRRANPEVATMFHKVSYQRSSRTDIGDESLIDRVPLAATLMRKVRNALR